MMTMERQMMMPGMTMNQPMGGTAGMNMMVIPRCTMKMEKCDGGMKMMCTCEDTMSTSMLQNLCTMLSGSMVSCCMMMNGMMMMNCNMTMGMCRFEMTKEGMMMTCTSGDKDCCKMIQACCDAMMTMMDAGCVCCLCMNNTPVCCSA
jgi:hypothetical protein